MWQHIFLFIAGKYFIAYDTIFKDDGCVGKRFCCYLVARSFLTLRDPMVCSPAGSPVHGISRARILEWVCELKVAQLCPTLCDPMNQSMEFSRPEYGSGQPFPSPGDLPNPGIKPRSPALQTDSLPAEPPGKPKNIGVGSLFLPQWIFLTQESNQCLLHCRQILYQLSCEDSQPTHKCFQ